LFWLYTAKVTAKVPAVDLLRLRYPTTFLSPKRCDEHPCPFYMGVCPPFTTALVELNAGIR